MPYLITNFYTEMIILSYECLFWPVLFFFSLLVQKDYLDETSYIFLLSSKTKNIMCPRGENRRKSNL